MFAIQQVEFRGFHLENCLDIPVGLFLEPLDEPCRFSPDAQSRPFGWSQIKDRSHVGEKPHGVAHNLFQRRKDLTFSSRLTQLPQSPHT